MEILYEHMEKFGGNYVNSDGNVDHDIEEHYTWILLKCPVCRKISLIQKYTDESMYNSITGKESYYVSNIYPLNRYKMDNVPSDIASAFEAALKIRDKVLELTKYDINEIATLLYAIINYLYIIPNKMIKLKDKLNDLEDEEVTNGI